MDDLRYPIGEFKMEGKVTAAKRKKWISEIERVPRALHDAVHGLSDEQLDTPYREGGWTVRQLVHHMADSHLNAYVRFKLALTEDVPTIKPYDQERWAELPDARTAPVEISLTFLEALHLRFVRMLQDISARDYKRKFHHPEMGQDISLETNLALYAWHGLHHISHIKALRKRKGW